MRSHFKGNFKTRKLLTNGNELSKPENKEIENAKNAFFFLSGDDETECSKVFPRLSQKLQERQE